MERRSNCEAQHAMCASATGAQTKLSHRPLPPTGGTLILKRWSGNHSQLPVPSHRGKAFSMSESGTVVPLLISSASAPWRPSDAGGDNAPHSHDGEVWSVLTTTSDGGNVTQGQGVPDHQVLPIGGVQHVQAVCHCFRFLYLVQAPTPQVHPHLGERPSPKAGRYLVLGTRRRGLFPLW